MVSAADRLIAWACAASLDMISHKSLHCKHFLAENLHILVIYLEPSEFCKIRGCLRGQLTQSVCNELGV